MSNGNQIIIIKEKLRSLKSGDYKLNIANSDPSIEIKFKVANFESLPEIKIHQHDSQKNEIKLSYDIHMKGLFYTNNDDV